jgi:hypothetical protein
VQVVSDGVEFSWEELEFADDYQCETIMFKAIQWEQFAEDWHEILGPNIAGIGVELFAFVCFMLVSYMVRLDQCYGDMLWRQAANCFC